MAFDIEGARTAGYSDAEIAEFMAGESNFDIAGARNAGYSDQDVIAHLSESSQPAETPQRKLSGLVGGMMEAEEQKLIGVGAGMTDVGQGLKQLYMQATGDERLPEYTRDVEAERAAYEQTPVAQSPAGRGGRILGATLPYMAIPGAAAGASLPARVAAGAGAGAAMGVTGFVPEGESRLSETAKGAAIGAAVPVGVEAARSVIAKGVGAAKGIFDPRTQDVIEQGERFDVPVYAPDVAGPGVQKAAQYLEDVPVIGMRGERVAQMQAAQQAAERLRGKYAQEGADDVGRIIQSGMRSKGAVVRAIKSGKYEKVAAVADDLGVVPTNKMQASANDIISRELSKQEGYRDVPLIRQIERYTQSPEAKFSDLQLLRAELGERIRALQTAKMPMQSAGELNALKNIKSALESDMESFATSSGDDLARLWKNADKYYKMKFLPFKEPEIQRAIKNDEPDRIFDHFVRRGFGDRARKFYNALDNKGRQAVRYGIIDKAYQRAYDDTTGVFSPAKFAGEIEKVDDAARTFFKGKDYDELKGFSNLMRHVQRAGQVGPGPATGVQTIPFLIGGGLGGLSVTSPAAGAATIGATWAVKRLFTTKTGRNLLLASAKVRPGSPGAQKVAQKIEDFLVRGAATESTNTPYQQQ